MSYAFSFLLSVVCTYLQSFILIDHVALGVIKLLLYKKYAFVSVRFMIPTLVGFCSQMCAVADGHKP